MKFNKFFTNVFTENFSGEIEKEKESILTCIREIIDNPEFDYNISLVKNYHNHKLLKIGEHGKVKIYLVNGNAVKVNLWRDFVEGGNDAVYGGQKHSFENFMPVNHIWVDAEINRDAVPYILFHELIERFIMEKFDYEYEDAHQIADRNEMKLRKAKYFDLLKKTLDFPLSKQPNGYSCGHAVTQMLCKFYGIDIRIDDIGAQYTNKKNKYGLTPDMIKDTLNKNGLKAKILEDLDVDIIKHTYIDNNIPVIVEFQAWDDTEKNLEKQNKNGHYAVVIGYTENYLFLSDPSLNSRGHIKIEDFEKRWHDINHDKFDKKLAIVVDKKPKVNDLYNNEKTELIEQRN